MADYFRLSVGTANDVWHLDAEGRIFHWNGSAWSQPGNPADRAIDIAAGTNGSAWRVDPAGKISEWDGASKTWKGPDTIAKDVKAISVAPDGTVWCVNKNGTVYWKPKGGAWTETPSQPRPAPGATWQYKVRQGDRLYQIVREQYKVGEAQIGPIVEQIVALNKDKIADRDNIPAGITLTMPPRQ